MEDAVLAVEVVSPSSGLRDRKTKRALHARLTESALGRDKAYVRVADRVTGVFRTEDDG